MLKTGTASQILFQDNNDKVVLIVHGFRVSPDNFSELSRKLYEHGFSVYNLRLPGHGTISDKSIYKTSLRHWEQYVEDVYLDLKSRFKEVYACGMSLGGALVLSILSKYNGITRSVLYAPAIKFKFQDRVLINIARFFKRTKKNVRMDCSIKNSEPRGYMYFLPIPQVYEVYKLTKKILKKLDKNMQNVLCFLAVNDHVFDYNELKNILTKKTGFTFCTLEKSFHNHLLDVEKELVINKTIEWLIK